MIKPPHNGKGVQAYRWLVSIGTGATVLLALWILDTVKGTARDVTVLQVDVSTVKAMQIYQNTRIDAVERRNDLQDSKIDTLGQHIWRFSPVNKDKDNAP